MNYEEEYEVEYEDNYPDSIGEDDNDTLEKAKMMYRQSPEPPKEELQAYIRQYMETKDERFFFWFLHYYEPQMNQKAAAYAKGCDSESLADIKQSMSVGLYKALNSYDISQSPFLPYAEPFMDREVKSYLRTTVPPYSVQSEFEYARLRKVMALYQEYDQKIDRETIKKIAEQVNTSQRKVLEILIGGLRNGSRVDNTDEDGSEREDLYIDDASDPAQLAEKLDLHERLYFLYYSLNWTERTMLAQRLGFCPECLSTHYRDRSDRDEYGDPKLKAIKPLPYTDISTLHGQSDPDTAKRTCEGALGKMYRELMDSGNNSGKIEN